MITVKTLTKPNQPSIFLGIEKDREVYIRSLDFKDGIEVDLDLVFSSVVLRHRKILKEIFNSTNQNHLDSAAKKLQIEDLFDVNTETSLVCDSEHLVSSCDLEDFLLFYLSKDQKWMIVGNYDILQIPEPKPFVDVLKNHYEFYYPNEVTEFCFKDPKDIKRVYLVEEHNGMEDFHIESLFIESDVVEHVYVPLKSTQAA